MKMKLNNCKLKKNTQLRLLEYFVLEVTARSAANLLDIHPNAAALFYNKIRHIISFQLALQATALTLSGLTAGGPSTVCSCRQGLLMK